MMEYNGQKLGQSMAIARLLAREYDLYGKGNWEAAQVDMIIDCVSDLISSTKACRIASLLGSKSKMLYYPHIDLAEAVPAVLESDEAKRKEMLQKFAEEHLAPFFKFMEGILSKNGGQFLVGKQVTSKWHFQATTDVTCSTELRPLCFEDEL